MKGRLPCSFGEIVQRPSYAGAGRLQNRFFSQPSNAITLIWMFVSILARLGRRRNGALLAAAETFSGEAR